MKSLPKKKILYLVNHFKFHGGIEKMLSNKIDAWVEYYDYEVVVVTLNQENAAIVYPPTHNFRLIDLGLKKTNGKRIKSIYQFYKKVKEILSTEQPDVVITTLTGIPSLILPLIIPEIKKYLEIHSSGALSVTKSWKYKWWFLNKYNGVIVLNEDEKQYYALENLLVIPNFVNPSSNKIPKYEGRNKTIVSAGRIHADKQYDHLIKAWQNIYQKLPEWTVEIYGDGDPAILSQYKDYISSINLERISFKKSIPALEGVLQNSSLFLLTSQTECFPMVLLECKMAALPAISYDAPNGPRHIIKNDGVLTTHNNIEELSKQIQNLINNDNLRMDMAKNAYENRNLFLAKNIIKQWQKLI